MIAWIWLCLVAGVGDAALFAMHQDWWWLAGGSGLAFGAAAGLAWAEGWRREAVAWEALYIEMAEQVEAVCATPRSTRQRRP